MLAGDGHSRILLWFGHPRGTMGPMVSRNSGSFVDLANRGWVVLWLLAVPVLAVSVLLWLGQPPEPLPGEVVGSSVSQTDEGLVGDVRWVDEDGVRRVRSFSLTEDQVTSGTVLLVSAENRVRVSDPSRDTAPLAISVAVTAVVAFLFAVVVLATLRGFGFVRGTGQPGEMTPDEVEESHGFYWRH